MVETSSFENALIQDFSSLNCGFLFTSLWKSLMTQGCYTTINQSVQDASQLDGEFQQQLRQHFAAAKKQGIEKPLLVGAIPFDINQPAALFIPESHQTFERDDLLASLPARGTPASLQVRRHAAMPDHDVFTDMVAQAIAATQRGDLDKVVLSRLMDIATEQPVDTGALMQRIMLQNPTSYHFHLPLPQGGALVGASPELMLRKQGRDFSSCPLAGSARRQAEKEQDRAAGALLMDSSKDRHEHKLVTDAMRDVLQPRSRLLSVPTSPTLLTTSTLWHLATHIDGEVRDERENALSLACLLHPTPALSGFPHQRAQHLIQQLEPFERQLFGGIVGWCDAEGNGEWVVTIRCGTVHGSRVRLFAGAGIVADSQPESEWRETGVKLDTMLRAFGLQ